MTVGELKKHLKHFPEDYEVVFTDHNNVAHEISPEPMAGMYFPEEGVAYGGLQDRDTDCIYCLVLDTDMSNWHIPDDVIKIEQRLSDAPKSLWIKWKDVMAVLKKEVPGLPSPTSKVQRGGSFNMIWEFESIYLTVMYTAGLSKCITCRYFNESSELPHPCETFEFTGMIPPSELLPALVELAKSKSRLISVN